MSWLEVSVNKKEGGKYVHLGTPIFLGEEENKDLKKSKQKYLPEWEQEVRDEKGRRRFHGAFTGGFSAGYFNTVGSKEGWTPTQFRSSRTQKQKIEQKITDFMDEEDLQDIAQTTLGAKEEYQSFGFTEREKLKSVIPGFDQYIPQDLIVPPKESIGEKLLQRMGWKKGEGIGNKRIERKKIYGAHFPGRESHINLFEEIPTPDTKVIVYEEKNNIFGLGYDPHQYTPEFKQRENPLQKLKERRRGVVNMADVFSTGGSSNLTDFGIGVLDNQGDYDDDIDVYGNDKIEYVRELYDDEQEKKHPWKDTDAEKNVEREAFIKQVDVGGKKAIRGFVYSQRIEPLTKKYEAPQPPPDWEPKFIPPSDISITKEYALSAGERGKILGEVPLPDQDLLEERFEKVKELRERNEGLLVPQTPEQVDMQRRLSEAMNSRFIMGKDQDFALRQPRMGLVKPTKENNEQVVQKKEIESGEITREVFEWHPESLLCKRFGVKNPYPGTKSGTVKTSKSQIPTIFDNSLFGLPNLGTPTEIEVKKEKKQKDEVDDELLKDDEEEEIEQVERPSIDIFKAIFEDEEEEEEENMEEEKKDEEKMERKDEEKNIEDKSIKEELKEELREEPKEEQKGEPKEEPKEELKEEPKKKEEEMKPTFIPRGNKKKIQQKKLPSMGNTNLVKPSFASLLEDEEMEEEIPMTLNKREKQTRQRNVEEEPKVEKEKKEEEEIPKMEEDDIFPFKIPNRQQTSIGPSITSNPPKIEIKEQKKKEKKEKKEEQVKKVKRQMTELEALLQGSVELYDSDDEKKRKKKKKKHDEKKRKKKYDSDDEKKRKKKKRKKHDEDKKKRKKKKRDYD